MAFKIAIFRSVNEVMYAETILKRAGIPYKIVPIPKEISSDCGVCIRFDEGLERKILKALEGKVEPVEVRKL